jgi:WD40 repeat protein
VTSLALSVEGSLLLSAGEDRAVRLWRSAEGARLRGFPAEDRGGCEAAWGGAVSPDGARVAVLCHSGPRPDLNPPEPFGTSGVRIYRSENGQPDGSFGLPNPGPGEVQFSPDGQYLYATSVGPGWWMQDGVLYDLARGTSDYLSTLLKAFVPDGVHYLDCEGNLVHAPSAQTVRAFGTHTNCAWPAAFSPNGTILAEGDGADVRLWQVNDGTLLRRLPGRTSASVTTTAFSPTGQHLFTSTPDNGLHVWRVADGAWLWSQTTVALAAFAPDGARLWTLGTDGRVRSWRVSDGSLTGSTTEQFSHRTAAFSPDGAWLFTGSSTGTLACWDVSDVTSP